MQVKMLLRREGFLCTPIVYAQVESSDIIPISLTRRRICSKVCIDPVCVVNTIIPQRGRRSLFEVTT